MIVPTNTWALVLFNSDFVTFFSLIWTSSLFKNYFLWLLFCSSLILALLAVHIGLLHIRELVEALDVESGVEIGENNHLIHYEGWWCWGWEGVLIFRSFDADRPQENDWSVDDLCVGCRRERSVLMLSWLRTWVKQCLIMCFLQERVPHHDIRLAVDNIDPCQVPSVSVRKEKATPTYRHMKVMTLPNWNSDLNISSKMMNFLLCWITV